MTKTAENIRPTTAIIKNFHSMLAAG